MSETRYEFEPPPDLPTDQHEAHVDQVRDVTKDKKIVLPASPNSDMGWRQAIPITYDIAISPPVDQVDTSEDE
jgi:hypothetical protein